MDLQGGLISLVLDVELLDQIATTMVEDGAIDRVLQLGVLPLGGRARDIRVLLNTPRVSEQAGSLVVTLDGTIELREPDAPEGEPERIALHLPVAVTLVRDEAQDGTPFLFAAPTGAAGPVQPRELGENLEVLFLQRRVRDAYAALRFDVFGPLIDAAEALFHPDESDRPARDAWKVGADVLPAPPGGRPAVALTLFHHGIRGGRLSRRWPEPTPLTAESPLDDGMLIAVAFGPNFLNAALADGAADQVGTVSEGAEITELSLRMGDDHIFVDGRAEKGAQATITFQGPIALSLRRASQLVLTDTRAVEVDVDVAWWARALAAFAVVFGGPVGTVGAGWISIQIRDGERSAPPLVRRGLATALSTELRALVAGIKGIEDAEEANVMVIPDHLQVADRTIVVVGEVAMGRERAFIVDGRRHRRLPNQRYSSSLKEFRLSNGREYSAGLLGEMLWRDLIEVPGYHGVRTTSRFGTWRYWVRANPDGRAGNNLRARFVDEVYIWG